MERGRGVEVGRSRHGSGGGGCRERGKENRWWKTVGYKARSRDQVRSRADGGAVNRAEFSSCGEAVSCRDVLVWTFRLRKGTHSLMTMCTLAGSLDLY